MLIDAEQLQDDSRIDADIVIVGGGVAGLSLARQLADDGHDVAVLESGGEKPDDRTQALYKGRMTLSGAGTSRDLGDYLTASRVRCYGGSGNVWGGKCGPLDPMDFERRAWIPHSGWPVDRRQMQPYYDRACALLEMERFDGPNGGIAGIRDGVFAGRSELFTPRPRRYTNYTGLSGSGNYDRFKRAASQHARVRNYLRANVTHIGLARNGRAVDALGLRCLNGRRITARARAYVLATGGIENVRLLLASNQVHRNGIGNHSDWLGRAFAGHSTISREATPAFLLMRSRLELTLYNNEPRDRAHLVMGASDLAQRRMQGVNFTTTLGRRVQNAPATTHALQTLAAVLAGSKEQTHLDAFFMLEQTPNRSSRVSLVDEPDELGMPRVQVDMRYNDLELDWLERMVSALARELGRLGLGRAQWAAGRDELISLMNLSRHHMGATRMSVSAADGVVDENCRVHGVGNLYVAGSSVFPTSGIVNPTLTLLALAFRLGDRLSAVLRNT
jgi:choline dehydrogenase-like flavoprotein